MGQRQDLHSVRQAKAAGRVLQASGQRPRRRGRCKECYRAAQRAAWAPIPEFKRADLFRLSVLSLQV